MLFGIQQFVRAVLKLAQFYLSQFVWLFLLFYKEFGFLQEFFLDNNKNWYKRKKVWF